MIPERTLKNWRKDSLKKHMTTKHLDPASIDIMFLRENELHERILRLTQELLDIQLMKKG
jgi:hypothetical protein